MLGVKVEQVNAKLGKCMATAKGTPVPSEMTPMYSGVKSLYGTKAGLVVKRRFFDSYGRRIAAVGLARYAGPIPQFFDFRPTENASTRQMC
ncbi:MAG: hypothetical protein DMG72_17030 [Acidobacteria bacterium]|nr:MAG: hypothetical protein DMG72_17030 [Acidobacteriota bacterium]